MERIVDFFRLLKIISALYWKGSANCVLYGAVLNHSIPRVTVLLGRGREAWRISAVALESKFIEGERQDIL